MRVGKEKRQYRGYRSKQPDNPALNIKERMVKTKRTRRVKVVNESPPVAMSEEVKPKTLHPGTKLDVGTRTARKVPWRIDDFRKLFGEVTVIPVSREYVTINGVRVLFEPNKEITVPKNFAGEYYRTLRGNQSTMIERPIEGVPYRLSGAGPLEPEPEEE